MKRAEKLLGLGLAVSLLLSAALVVAGEREAGEPLAQSQSEPVEAEPQALAESKVSERSPLADSEERRAAPKREAGALKLLFERAPKSEEARRALARLAFVSDASVSAELRRGASRALVASIPSAAREEAERLLRLEARPAELEQALQTLGADPNFRPR